MTFNIDKSPLLLKVLVLLGGGSAGLQGKGRWNHSEFKASLIYQMSSRIPGFTKTLSWKKQESALSCLKVSTSTWEVKSGWPRVQSQPGIRKLYLNHWNRNENVFLVLVSGHVVFCYTKKEVKQLSNAILFRWVILYAFIYTSHLTTWIIQIILPLLLSLLICILYW